jgi:hypothetical protein
MQVASTLNHREIKEISQPRTVSPSQLRVLARKADALAALVEKDWGNFSAQERNVLEAIIYTSISEKNGIANLVSSLQVRFSLAWILIKGETDVLIEYFNAFRRLKNAVLGAVETEHCEYEEKMTNALQEALNELDNSSAPLTASQFRDWLNTISD